MSALADRLRELRAEVALLRLCREVEAQEAEECREVQRLEAERDALLAALGGKK